jgi:hypothetical protein
VIKHALDLEAPKRSHFERLAESLLRADDPFRKSQPRRRQVETSPSVSADSTKLSSHMNYPKILIVGHALFANHKNLGVL